LIEFPFIEFESENLGKILKPFAFVELENDETSIGEYPMLIDSGVDVTLIPRVTEERLALKPPNENEVKSLGGIAGGVPVAYRTIDLKIENIKFPVRIAWSQIEDVPPVLGRVDVFDKFDIEFKQSERKIIFKIRE
jgi:hypothetical protein